MIKKQRFFIDIWLTELCPLLLIKIFFPTQCSDFSGIEVKAAHFQFYLLFESTSQSKKNLVFLDDFLYFDLRSK